MLTYKEIAVWTETFALVDAWQDCVWFLARDGRLSEV